MMARKYLFLFIICCSLGGKVLEASSLEVSPVRLKLEGQQTKTTVTITNKSDIPVLLQCTPMKWMKVKGKDIYEETRDIIATPPIVSIEPGEEQLFRVGLRGLQKSDQEVAYRIYFTEVLTQEHRKKGIQMLLSLGVPVFVTSKAVYSGDLK